MKFTTMHFTTVDIDLGIKEIYNKMSKKDKTKLINMLEKDGYLKKHTHIATKTKPYYINNDVIVSGSWDR